MDSMTFAPHPTNLNENEECRMDEDVEYGSIIHTTSIPSSGIKRNVM